MTLEEQITSAQRELEQLKKIQAAFTQITALAAEKLEGLNVELECNYQTVTVGISSKKTAAKEGLHFSRTKARFDLVISNDGDKLTVRNFSACIGDFFNVQDLPAVLRFMADVVELLAKI